LIFCYYLFNQVELTEKAGRVQKMNEPNQLEEYRQEIPKFINAAYRFQRDRSRLNYDRFAAACESHQRVTESACAFAREVIETTDPIVSDTYRSQLRPYMNAHGAQLGVLEEKPEGEIAPTSDLYALRRLQDDPELVRHLEHLKIPVAELRSSLEKWNALYRELYSFVFWDGRPLPVWSSSATSP
jgi:hypothetical protein